MGDTILPLALLGVLGLLLLAAGIGDARQRTIANGLNATIALLAPVWWWVQGLALWPDVPLQLLLAAVVLIAFAGLFALGAMGGGDVKLIAALALWLPVAPFLSLLFVMSITGGVVTVLMMIDRRIARRAEPPEVPYGVAIAIAGLLALREPIINHLS